MGKILGTGWGNSLLLLNVAETESIAPCQIQTDAEKQRQDGPNQISKVEGIITHIKRNCLHGCDCVLIAALAH